MHLLYYPFAKAYCFQVTMLLVDNTRYCIFSGWCCCMFVQVPLHISAYTFYLLFSFLYCFVSVFNKLDGKVCSLFLNKGSLTRAFSRVYVPRWLSGTSVARWDRPWLFTRHMVRVSHMVVENNNLPFARKSGLQYQILFFVCFMVMMMVYWKVYVWVSVLRAFDRLDLLLTTLQVALCFNPYSNFCYFWKSSLYLGFLCASTADAKLWNDFVIQTEIRKRFPEVWTSTDIAHNVSLMCSFTVNKLFKATFNIGGHIASTFVSHYTSHRKVHNDTGLVIWFVSEVQRDPLGPKLYVNTKFAYLVRSLLEEQYNQNCVSTFMHPRFQNNSLQYTSIYMHHYTSMYRIL